MRRFYFSKDNQSWCFFLRAVFDDINDLFLKLNWQHKIKWRSWSSRVPFHKFFFLLMFEIPLLPCPPRVSLLTLFFLFVGVVERLPFGDLLLVCCCCGSRWLAGGVLLLVGGGDGDPLLFPRGEETPGLWPRPPFKGLFGLNDPIVTMLLFLWGRKRGRNALFSL